MSFNVSALSAYVDANGKEIMRKVVLGGSTAKLVTVMPGIKTTKNLNLMSNTVYIQQGGSCGLVDSGSTILSTRAVSVCDCGILQPLCLDTLEDYYTQVQMKAGSYNEELPFEAIYVEDFVARVGQENDKLIWQGKEGASGNLGACNGLLHKFSGTSDSATTVTVTTVTGFTVSNAISAINTVVNNIPADAWAENDMTIFMSIPYFLIYQQALVAANYVHYNPGQVPVFEQVVPGVNAKVVATIGLNNTTKIIATPANNIVIGVDMIEDSEKMDIWYSKDDQKVKTLMKYKQGVTVKYPEFVVECTIQ